MRRKRSLACVALFRHRASSRVVRLVLGASNQSPVERATKYPSRLTLCFRSPPLMLRLHPMLALRDPIRVFCEGFPVSRRAQRLEI